MRYIKDLTEGNRIQGIYYCKSKNITETKAGKVYEHLFLQDKTGVLDAKVWEPNSPAIHEYEEGDFIEVSGDVIIYGGFRQARINRIRKCEEGEYDIMEYMPSSPYDIEEMFKKVLDLIDSVKDVYLKALLDSFFKDEGFAATFKKSSAAKSVHHAFMGGLLQHSLSVAQNCDYFCTHYPILKRDLLVTAALLHDIGKIRELSDFPENDYTDEGQLLGHIVIGSEWIGQKADEIEGFPKILKTQLQHCILAHHGELEYGSPKKPALVEAMVLNMADNIDAKIEIFSENLEAEPQKEWIGFNKILDSNIRHTTV